MKRNPIRRILSAAALALAGALFACPAFPDPLALPDEVREALAEAAIPEDAAGVAVQAADAPEFLVALNETRAFRTASVMKLVTTYAALEVLGPHFRWQTGAYAGGAVKDGVLFGDLYIKGSGDPSLMEEDLWAFVRQIRNAGIREIRGNLVLDRSVFGSLFHDPSVFDDRPLKAYNAGPDALLVNDRHIDVFFIPRGEDGGGVDVITEPRLDGIMLVPPAASDGPCGNWMEKTEVESGAGMIRFSGEYPLSCGRQTLTMNPYQMPDLQFFESIFSALWKESGGTIAGRAAYGLTPADALPAAVHLSRPLGAIVIDVNKFSNNVKARQILLTLGWKAFGDGATPEKGAEAVRALFREKNIPAETLVIENGSGLSRDEQISPAALAAVLKAAYDSPVMPELMGSLPVAGRDGTMRRRLKDTAADGRVHIKTGYISEVRALAGYVLAKSGKRYIAVFMINHENALAGKKAMDILLNWIAENG